MDEHVRSPSLIRRGAYDRTFFQGRVRLVGLGPNYRAPYTQAQVHDWSLRHVALPASSVRRFLPEVANIIGAHDILAPRPTDFNAKICNEEDLTELIELSDGTHSTVLHRGAQADGIILKSGQAYGGSAGGCPIVIVWDKNDEQVGAIHAGRQSVIDEHRFDSAPRRRHESAVHSLLEKMAGTKWRGIRNYRAIIAFPIPAETLTYSWRDPKYGELNRKRSKYVSEKWGHECTPGWEDTRRYLGMLSLEQLIRAQLVAGGLSPKNIRCVRLPPGWHTTRGAFPEYRNFYLVKFD